MWWRDWDGRPSRPRQARGGIKAQSKRGAFGQSWWAKRWIEVLEGFDIGARLGRGRSYARGGQVLAIQIDKGMVRAKVQGSRPRPYEVAIQAKVLTAAEWDRLATRLARQALYAAKLLAGEMPQDIEDAFREAGLSLFPAKLGDLTTKCNCPDWSNPCKHIAAVYYLLGEEFDRDPFLIFTLRGMTREELVERLGAALGEDHAPVPSGPSALLDAPALSRESLAADPSPFWGGSALPADLLGDVEAPATPAALPRRLGSFPFWRGEAPFLDTLDPVYARATPRGMDLLIGSETPSATGREGGPSR